MTIPTAMNPRTPVIVGVAHIRNRPDDLAEIVDAVTLMERALIAASVDAGSTRLLGEIDRIAVMQGRWRWPDPARLLAERVGASHARSVFAMASGNIAQELVADAAANVAAGRADVVAVCGGEWANGRRRLRDAGLPLPVSPQEAAEPDERFGENREWESPTELARGFSEPLVVYAMFESAIAAALGDDVEATRDRVARIAAGLSEVAAENDVAWSQQAVSMSAVREPTADNRFIAFPYTKRMVANPDVDLAFAILVCSAEAADRLGVHPDQWVFPVAAATCDDFCRFSELDRFDRSVHHRLTAAAALEGRVHIDDIEHVDLYSCFPAAVQLEADALGIDPLSRPITVTGGMPFFGGPLAGYMGHAIVRSAQLLREGSDSFALCVGNGGYLNKLASGLYGSSPPSERFRTVDVSDAAIRTPHRRACFEATSLAKAEASTVVFDRAGPALALVTALDADGHRYIGSSRDPHLMSDLLQDPHVGGPVAIDASGTVHIID